MILLWHLNIGGHSIFLAVAIFSLSDFLNKDTAHLYYWPEIYVSNHAGALLNFLSVRIYWQIDNVFIHDGKMRDDSRKGQFPFISKLCDYLMTMNNLPSGTMFNLGITSIMHIPAEWSSFGFCIIFVSLVIYKDPKKINIWIKEFNWMIPF